MSTEYTRTELLKRERLIVEGTQLIAALFMALIDKPPMLLSDFHFARDARAYLTKIEEDVPGLKDEISRL